MSCPHLLVSKHHRCAVFNGLYQPTAAERKEFCDTCNYKACKIYYFYETTCGRLNQDAVPASSENLPERNVPEAATLVH